MTVNWRHWISALAALGVIGVLSGCTSGLVSASDYDYDFKALDAYLVDRDDPAPALAQPVKSETAVGGAKVGSQAATSSRPRGKASTASWSASDFIGDWISTIGMSDDDSSFESTGDPEAFTTLAARFLGPTLDGVRPVQRHVAAQR